MKNRDLIALLSASPPDEEALVSMAPDADTASQISEVKRTYVRHPVTNRRKYITLIALKEYGEGIDYNLTLDDDVI